MDKHTNSMSSVMMSKWKLFVLDRRLTFLGVVGFVSAGFLMSYHSLEYLPYRWMRLAGLWVGLGIAAIGGFSGRAKALVLPPPFKNDPLGWRTAKECCDVDSKNNEGSS
jgi:hypothetical protein